MAAITYLDGRCRPLVSLRLRGDPRAPRRARLVLRDVLGELGVPDAPAGDGVTMASELVTNAVTHAPEPYVFRVCAHAGPLPGGDPPDAGPLDGLPGGSAWLMCEMTDGGPVESLFDRAPPPDDDPLAAGGRGLPLVRRLSRGRCGVRPLAYGKSVWFAVPHP